MRKTILCTLAMVALSAGIEAAEQPKVAGAEAKQQNAPATSVPKPVGEITAERVGSRVIYRYKDAEGHTVLLDQPPPGYAASKFVNMAPPTADAPESSETPAPPPPTAVDAGESLPERLLRLAPWVALGALVLAAAIWSAPHLLRRLRRELARRRTLTSVLDRSGYATMHGVILPLSGGRTGYFDHIVRTPSGLLVIGSERPVAVLPRPSIANANAKGDAKPKSPPPRDPAEVKKEIARLDARVEAVKALAPGVPVFGRFVCTGEVPADAPPARVISLPKFAQALPSFRRDDSPNATALDAAWHKLRTCAGRVDPPDPGASATNKR